MRTARSVAGTRRTDICRPSVPRHTTGRSRHLPCRSTVKSWLPAAATAKSRSGPSTLSSPPKAFASIESKVQSLALTRDGKLLVTASADGSVQLWDTTSGKEQGDPIKFEAKEVHVAFSPDGKILATLPVGTNMAALKLWDTATKHELDLLAVVPDDARTLAFTPDGHSLATAGSSVNVWGWAGAPAFRTLKGTPGLTRTIAVSRDGSTIATAGAEGVVMLWDVADGVPVGKLEGHTKATWCVAFSPDSKTLASGGADRTVRLWNVSAQTEKATLRGAKKAVTALAFAPDGKTLASSCDGDPTVSFWDVASSRLAATLTLPDPVPGEGVACLAFASDGKTLYTGGEHRNIRMGRVSGEPGLESKGRFVEGTGAT